MTFKHGLATFVRDKVTGFEGIIISRSEHLHGCTRYNVRPQELNKEGKSREAVAFDEDSLDVIGDGLSKDLDQPLNFLYELGSRAKDKVTGFEGIITTRTQWLYGTNVYGITPTKLHEGATIKPEGFDEHAVEILKMAEPHKMRQTGGPGEPARQARDF